MCPLRTPGRPPRRCTTRAVAGAVAGASMEPGQWDQWRLVDCQAWRDHEVRKR
jgi:hypothetical protein